MKIYYKKNQKVMDSIEVLVAKKSSATIAFDITNENVSYIGKGQYEWTEPSGHVLGITKRKEVINEIKKQGYTLVIHNY